MKRRFFLQSAAVLPGLAAETATTTPLKVVCVGGHPDDPESGCGGMLARYVEAGHRVTIGVHRRSSAANINVLRRLEHYGLNWPPMDADQRRSSSRLRRGLL
jgi:hypothetical protein